MITPDYYDPDSVYEPIKLWHRWQLNAFAGNIIKYMVRCGSKPNTDDEGKAVTYLKRWLEVEPTYKLFVGFDGNLPQLDDAKNVAEHYGLDYIELWRFIMRPTETRLRNLCRQRAQATMNIEEIDSEACQMIDLLEPPTLF